MARQSKYPEEFRTLVGPHRDELTLTLGIVRLLVLVLGSGRSRGSAPSRPRFRPSCREPLCAVQVRDIGWIRLGRVAPPGPRHRRRRNTLGIDHTPGTDGAGNLYLVA